MIIEAGKSERFEGYVNGIPFLSHLHSIDGVMIELFPRKHHTKENIAKAQSELRSERDVVYFRIIGWKPNGNS